MEKNGSDDVGRGIKKDERYQADPEEISRRVGRVLLLRLRSYDREK